MLEIRFFKTTILQKILLLVFLIELNFFYVFPLPEIFWKGNNGDNKSYIMLILYAVIFVVAIISRNVVVNNEYYLFVVKFLAIQIALSFLLVLRSKNLFNQSWFDMAMCGDYLMMPICTMPFMMAMKEDMDFKKMMHILFCMIVIAQVVIFIQGIYYDATNTMLFKGMSATGSARVRLGNLRATWSTLNFIAIVYSFWIIIEQPDVITGYMQALIMFSLSVINIVFFCNTRSVMIASFITFIVMFLMSETVSRFKKTILILLLFVAIVGFGLIRFIISSFDINGALGGSTSVRLREIEYYWGCFVKNPLTGLGLIRPKNTLTYLLYGGPYSGTPTDVGILGLASETGLIGVGVYSILYFRSVFIINKMRSSEYRTLLIGLLIYITATLPTLIITNIGLSLGLVVVIAIFEGVYYRFKTGDDVEEAEQ